MNKIDKDTIKNPFWAMSAEDSVAILRSSYLGVSNQEVSERKKIFGKNKIISQKQFVVLKLFLRQFESPLIYILVLAGIVTLLLGDFSDAIFIFTAVFINVSLGFYQENKAEKALESLANYLEIKTRVIREGKIKEINIEELVPGDIINFSSGDSIPADCRIIQSNNLLIDEAILTGESLPVEKGVRTVGLRVGLGDKKSMVFSGTSVVEGLGSAVVVSTGKDTELGLIASLMASIKDEVTPLQKNINSFANKLTIMVLLLSFMVFVLGLFYEYSILEMFTMSVAIAVAAVPEGLAISLTVILAVGVERLAKKKGVVRRLSSSETLGDTSVILTDKTGTLTMAKMNLVRVEVPYLENQNNLLDYQKEILKFAILCTDARVENPEAPISEWRVIGKSLDSALIIGAAKNFELKEFDIRKRASVIDRLPFNSSNKFSAVKIREGEIESTLMIGAPEVVLKMCHNFYWNGKNAISDKERSDLLKEVHKNAGDGYRIISVAFSEKNKNTQLKDIKKIDGFYYLGNLLLKDPIRKEVGQAIKEIQKEGIRTIIVTGDHTGTAKSVAREIGMDIDENSVIEQHELDLLSDEELQAKLSSVRIFSRINPESKVRIARLFQNNGHVVAMTGDGVNDAPALKQADVGIAIGSGSGVARESSDLVLLDDSFHTIVSAIDEGRRILQNIRKVLVFCLTSLFDELILVGGSIILNIPIPLNALQILWVNFIADSFPAVSLSYEDEKNKEEIIRRKISRESVFDKEVKFLVWVIGILTSILLFSLHVIMLKLGIEEGLVRTFIFASFGIYTLMLIFSIRSLDKNIWEYNPFSNWLTNLSSAVGLLLMFVAIYFPPAQALLDTVSLPEPWILSVFGVGFSCIVMVEVGKFIFIRKKMVR
ncbi:MAG: ATPase, P-type (Transporting), HAD superfamily, subfamily IC [Parcubacteria group bacterium GW2011_GWF2_38_76]|nr:MAG: ATPase, P-type (Transporting), HAD superfamily, subfamily IC [Parcubacteria group bacterium GW2011_GWF2_38_76]HBM45812.1 hypothetical protein [Patescibacteria group bacterium]